MSSDAKEVAWIKSKNQTFFVFGGYIATVKQQIAVFSPTHREVVVTVILLGVYAFNDFVRYGFFIDVLKENPGAQSSAVGECDQHAAQNPQ